MNSNRGRGIDIAHAGLEEVLAGRVVAPDSIPNAKPRLSPAVQQFGQDTRSMPVAIDRDKLQLEPIQSSGNQKDDVPEVLTGALRVTSEQRIYDPGVGTWNRPTGNYSVKVFEPIARDAETSSERQVNRNCRGLHLILNVISGAAVANEVTPILEGYEPIFGTWYPILTGTAINSNGVNILKLYPGISGVGDIRADVLPKQWRLRIEHAGGDDVVYSAVANLMV